MPVIVGTVIEKDSKFLLVQEAGENVRGKWNYPSGKLETGELLSEGILRETREECGLDVELTGICQVGTHRFPNEAFALVCFAAHHRSGKIKFDPEEILDACWFSYEEILEMSDQLRNADRVIHAIQNVKDGIVAPLEILKIYANPEDLKTNE